MGAAIAVTTANAARAIHTEVAEHHKAMIDHLRRGKHAPCNPDELSDIANSVCMSFPAPTHPPEAGPQPPRTLNRHGRPRRNANTDSNAAKAFQTVSGLASTNAVRALWLMELFGVIARQPSQTPNRFRVTHIAAARTSGPGTRRRLGSLRLPVCLNKFSSRI